MQAFCDNTAAVGAINARVSKDKHMMHILRCLFFIEAYHQFQLTARHFPGIQNTMADDLSRNQLGKLCSNASANPSVASPRFLVTVATEPSRDWTSPSWIQLFSSSVQRT